MAEYYKFIMNDPLLLGKLRKVRFIEFSRIARRHKQWRASQAPILKDIWLNDATATEFVEIIDASRKEGLATKEDIKDSEIPLVKWVIGLMTDLVKWLIS